MHLRASAISCDPPDDRWYTIIICNQIEPCTAPSSLEGMSDMLRPAGWKAQLNDDSSAKFAHLLQNFGHVWQEPASLTKASLTVGSAFWRLLLGHHPLDNNTCHIGVRPKRTRQEGVGLPLDGDRVAPVDVVEEERQRLVCLTQRSYQYGDGIGRGTEIRVLATCCDGRNSPCGTWDSSRWSSASNSCHGGMNTRIAFAEISSSVARLLPKLVDPTKREEAIVAWLVACCNWLNAEAASR
eukprot:scaffold4342_cov27-Tisochrysis_lutea.AAC.2